MGNRRTERYTERGVQALTFKLVLIYPDDRADRIEATRLHLKLAARPEVAGLGVTHFGPAQVSVQQLPDGQTKTLVAVTYGTTAALTPATHGRIAQIAEDTLAALPGIVAKAVVTQLVDRAVAGALAGVGTGGATGATLFRSQDAWSRFAAAALGSIVLGAAGALAGSFLRHERVVFVATKDALGRWSVQAAA